jgi:hypothetical protein
MAEYQGGIVEQTGTGPVHGRKLVLGFDAGCVTCSGLARSIEEVVGDKLEIRGLNDPMMEHWRREVFGEDAPWVPTLVEVAGGTVKAWTGARMGARLARRLGPATTWRVAKILGEMKKVRSAEYFPYSSLSRSQFLKGVGGAVIGMSVLSGTGSLAAPAAANEHWLSQISLTSSKELSMKEAAAAWAQLARGRHLRGLLSSRALNNNAAARRIGSRMLSAGKTGVASPSKATMKGVNHAVEGGGWLLALVYQEGDALIASYRFDKPDQETRLLSRVIKDESEETIRVLAEAEDGDIFAALRGEAGKYEGAVTGRGRQCRGERQCPGVCSVCRCSSQNKRCMFNCCGPCALACLGGWKTCLACVFAWCPICASVNRCCRYRECTYNAACS